MAREVLYLVNEGLSENIPQSQVLGYLKKLSGYGYRFTIISFEKPEILKDREPEIRSELEAHHIKWHYLPYSHGIPVVSPIWNVMKIISLGKKLMQQHNYSLIHCRAHLMTLAGFAIKKGTSAKLLFDMRGFWADENRDMGVWKLSNPLYKRIYTFFKKRERKFIEESDAMVCLTEAAKREILGWKDIKVTADKITVVPCCVDTNSFNYHNNDAQHQHILRQKLKIEDDAFVVSFLGNTGNLYMRETMMHFFKLLLRKKPQAYFLFITTQSPHIIYAMCDKEGVPRERIRIMGGNKTEVPRILSLSSFSLFFIRPLYSKIASSPTKQGEIMAMGIPLVTNSGIGDTAEIVNDAHAGVLTHAFTDAEFEKAIDEILANRFKPEEIRAGALKYYSLEMGSERYLAAYRRLIG